MRAADFKRYLSMADVDERMRQARKAATQFGGQCGRVVVVRDQQVLVRSEPQRGSRASARGAAGLDCKRDPERCACRRLRDQSPRKTSRVAGGSTRTEPGVAIAIDCRTAASDMQACSRRIVEHRRGDLDGDIALRHRHLQSSVRSRARPSTTMASAIDRPTTALAYDEVTWPISRIGGFWPGLGSDLRALLQHDRRDRP